jgi:cyanophycinase
LKLASIVAAVCCLFAGSATAAGRGHLLLNGGGGETRDFWQKFVDLAGGPGAPIVVLPTASERPEAGIEYVDELRQEWALTDVTSLELRSREDASQPEIVAALSRARGIFFTGGDQSRITGALLDTPAMAAVRKVFESGGVLAGSSAGTACMSEVMITGEGDFGALRAGAVETVRGLGFVENAVVDQHFVTRQRLNRLLSVALETGLPGLGIDEKCALWIAPDGSVEVLGEGSVVLVDPRAAIVRRVHEDRPRFGADGVVLRLLLPGDHLPASFLNLAGSPP